MRRKIEEPSGSQDVSANTDHREISLLGARIPLISLIQALAVAEHLSFRHAAAALGVTQSSVSTRIKFLEHDLGILLFERRHRGVRITEAGSRFLEEVRAGVDHLDHAVKTARAIARGEQGRLRIGLHAALTKGYLWDVLNRYRAQHPAILISMTEGRADDMIHQVRDHQIDIAFVSCVAIGEDCHHCGLWTENLVIALSENHTLAGLSRLSWGDLAAEIFLIRNAGTGPQLRDQILRRAGECGFDAVIHRWDVERLTLFQMVAQGHGVTLTTDAMAAVPVSGVVFIPIVDDMSPITFNAVWSPHNREPALLDFLALAKQATRAPPSGGLLE